MTIDPKLPLSKQCPVTVYIAVGLLAFNSLILIAWWSVFPEQIESNGGQVFFIMLWTACAWAIVAGAGWVRYAIALTIVFFVWGIANADTGWNSIHDINLGDVTTKLVACISVVLLFAPSSVRWFQPIVNLAREAKTKSD